MAKPTLEGAKSNVQYQTPDKSNVAPLAPPEPSSVKPQAPPEPSDVQPQVESSAVAP